jgi:hypothetical protein
VLSQVVELIENKNRFGITTHIKPDGDGVGSSLGLCWLLKSLGKSAEVIVRGEIPASYRSLPGADAIKKEVILGKALVQETFKVSKIGTIAGCKVTDGVIRRQAKARLIRDGVVAWEGDIATLKRFKDDASEVKSGYECGISLVNFNDIKVGDEIEAYMIESIAATEL